jgi:hypothetical protein
LNIGQILQRRCDLSAGRPHEPPLPDPLAFFITWSTYGTWLPGDDRGWIEYRRGWQLPDPARELEAQAAMTEDACILDREQRQLVEDTIADDCEKRGWQLHSVNCRSNHLYVVVSANCHPKRVRAQFNAFFGLGLVCGKPVEIVIQSLYVMACPRRKIEQVWTIQASVRQFPSCIAGSGAAAAVRSGGSQCSVKEAEAKPCS